MADVSRDKNLFDPIGAENRVKKASSKRPALGRICFTLGLLNGRRLLRLAYPSYIALFGAELKEHMVALLRPGLNFNRAQER